VTTREDATPPGSSPTGSSRRPPLERTLRDGVRARDRAALAAFYERYFEEVYALTFRLLGVREAAEDVTQDVFVKVHRAADRLDAARDPMPWLASIVWNSCRDHWRSAPHRMLRRSSDVSAPAVAATLTDGSDPAQEFQHAERERIVQGALCELPESLRAVVVLHDFGGLDLSEVARAIGVSHAAARKRHSRALDRLGELLRGRLEP
jgi:RNA polymerase sigma-70 factor (ECF subfamily)